MHPIEFVPLGWSSAGALEGDYFPAMVALSVGVAIVASFVGFSQIELTRSASQRGLGIVWRLMGAVALGFGVWTMHFVGMLAYTLPVTVTYRVDGTLLSMLPAIATAYLTLKILAREHVSKRLIVTGGIMMGAGICAMHYIGMAAMVAPLTALFRPGVFAASIVVAMVAATVALAGHVTLHARMPRPGVALVASACLMGIAISAMHYVGMAAVVYVPGGGEGMTLTPLLSDHVLAGVVGVSALILLSMALASIELRRRVEHAARRAARLETRAQALDEQLRSIASRLPGVIYRFSRRPDGSYAFPYASEAMRDIYGFAPEELQEDASAVMAVIHPDDRESVMKTIERSAVTGKPWQHQYRARLRDGRELWLMGNAVPRTEADGTVNWDGFIMDITVQKRAEETIERLAFRDSLTGLANRTTFTRRLQERLRKGERGALFFLDLDRFKVVNDLRGHGAGDELLKAVAGGLLEVTGEADLVARLGGDEFVVAVAQTGPDELGSVVAFQLFANRLRTAVSRAAGRSYGTKLARSASVGVCLYHPRDGLDAAELLKRADIAMYRAKEAGGNAVRFFDADMGRTMEARYILEQELAGAAERGELEIYLQRQVDHDGAIVGAEALLRWRHPRKGLVPPSEFIPLAEETGLIVPVGDWVLKAVCAQLSCWETDPELAGIPIAVNVSARQFFESDFADKAIATARAAGIDPSLLKLEITESLILQDLEDAKGSVRALQQHGFRLSIDDFGTGYSSLAYLVQLDFDELKIDQSFTSRLCDPDREREHLVVDMIIDLGHKLGIRICAEGVETEEQFRALKRSGCDTFQGYYFERPVPAADFATSYPMASLPVAVAG